jgi:hypothetical protein
MIETFGQDSVTAGHIGATGDSARNIDQNQRFGTKSAKTSADKKLWPGCLTLETLLRLMGLRATWTFSDHAGVRIDVPEMPIPTRFLYLLI